MRQGSTSYARIADRYERVRGGAQRAQRLELTICAPFRLEDLFRMIVRPNKRLVTRELYESKARRWAETWPRLTALEW